MNVSRNTFLLIVLWLMASLIGSLMAMNYLSASLVDGLYIPVGNDSFYHARRILDAAVSERGFYQFDNMIHVPEGSWLTWPWAFDYLMALALRIALWLDPQIEAMKFLAYIPVVWLPVNLGFFLLIAREIRLGPGLASIAMLAAALAPAYQALHAVGAIDHHFMELTFTLAMVWLGLRFFAAPDNPRRAMLLGVTLGIAPAFHNSLFILQIPVLMCAALLWIVGKPLASQISKILGISLLTACFVALIPSETFWDFQFGFHTHSWFHLYVAACSAITLFLLSRVTFSVRTAGLFVAVGVALVIPIVLQISRAAAFLAGDTIVLGSIAEVASPLRMYFEAGNASVVTRYYSWLIVLAPILVGIFAVRLFRERDAREVFLACAIIFGLSLVLTQFRLHPFGFWALILGPLYLVHELAERRNLNSAVVGVACLAVLALAYQPPLRNQLFKVFPPGLSKDYAASRSLFPVLAEACEEEPGVALSYNNDGHPIRYHTNCSVIVNNFLLTQQHRDKYVEAAVLLKLTPEQFHSLATNVDYLFVRLYKLFEPGPDGFVPTSIEKVKESNVPLFLGLLLQDELPPGFKLLGELRVQDERDIPFARVIKVERKAE